MRARRRRAGVRVLLSIVCIMLILPAKHAEATVFNDTGNHWANYYIDEMSKDELGFINGVTSTMFYPD